jgi:hypothetical protein
MGKSNPPGFSYGQNALSSENKVIKLLFYDYSEIILLMENVRQAQTG